MAGGLSTFSAAAFGLLPHVCVRAILVRRRGNAHNAAKEEYDMNRLHLICNAHLDPVWLWEWEEGAAEALSTFRTATDLCDENEDFVFNHNEVTLYRYVEEYEPALFERIRKLVAAKRWHIMGGWYLQPDCNMPAGESFVRQILMGKAYFKEKFGVEPTTAINFDPFGHNRGLVQILKKSGYDSYLFCRPFQNDCALPSDDFTWVGFDGSEVTGHRASMFYNQPLGQAREKVERWMKEHPGKSPGLVLWGVGNHGGGPSRVDLERLAQLRAECGEYDILHSTPENYFRELRESGIELPRFENEINPWGPGCYTSQVRIKQKHRLLENTLYQCEKMASSAAIQGLMPYPKEELREALRDLLVAEFHDILPGSSVQPVEDNGLRLMDHGQELLTRVRARAFFALSGGQPKPKEGEIPILVFNPHPFPVRTTVECEFQLPDFQWGEQFTIPIVQQNGARIPSQCEQELGNLNLDWRKRAVFTADLAPFQMNRFDCALEVLRERPKPALKASNGRLSFRTDDLDVEINCATGWIDRLAVKGKSYLQEGAFKLLVIADNEDPWETRYQSFRNVIGVFELMDRGEGTRFSGVTQTILESVRVIEDGEVRTVVEALFRYENSFAILHYKLPKQGTEVEIALRVHWNEKSKMLKLAVPTLLNNPKYLGQVAYGVQEFPTTGRECVAQKWTAAVSDEDDRALTCINAGTYGSDFANGELRISLLRGPAYSAHPIGDRPLVRQDRYSPRIDQGERLFRFWFNCGGKTERMKSVDREALVLNERPFALSFNPSGMGQTPKPMIIVEDDIVQLAAFKQAEQSEDYIVRLFEPSGAARTFWLSFPALDFSREITIGAFEIKSFRLNPEMRTLVECDLLERTA